MTPFTPVAKEKNKRVVIPVAFKPSLASALSAMSSKTKLSRQEIIQQMIAHCLREMEETQPKREIRSYLDSNA